MRMLLMGTIIFLSLLETSFGAPLLAGLLSSEKGTLEILRQDRVLTVDPGDVSSIRLGDLLRSDDEFEGFVLPFDGSKYRLGSRTTHVIWEDGVFGQVDNGWLLLHGFLIQLSSKRALNGAVPRGAQGGGKWYCSSPALVETALGSLSPAKSGSLMNNHLLKVTEKAIAKVDWSGQGKALLRSGSHLRLVPGGFSLERGGAMVHLGSRERAALWTPRLRAESIDALLEVSSLDGEDVFKVYRGRVLCRIHPAFVRDKRGFVLRAGQSARVDARGGIEQERFKPSSKALSIASAFIERMGQEALSGFPRWQDEKDGLSTAGGAEKPVRKGSQQSPYSPPELKPGPRVGKDAEGRDHLNPMRRRVPGESAKDWTRL